MVEEVEALCEQFDLTHGVEVETFGKAQICLPGCRITIGVAADAVDPVIATITVHAGRKSDDGCATLVELFGKRAGSAHGVGQAGVEGSDGREHPALCKKSVLAEHSPVRLEDYGARNRVAYVETAGAIFSARISGIKDAGTAHDRTLIGVPV